MPKQGYCVTVFYSGDDIANIEILPTQDAKHLILASRVGAEKRSFKVYRLGPLLAKCVREPSSGATLVAAVAYACPCEDTTEKDVRCPICGMWPAPRH